ncbi:PLP-dependent aminotransferase family protein [Aggregicoccus sp. 17bor-14]|uniref:MocR-like pyridoxine biosynthesis transcription factor PdxR n=1 Tax=Myxococcaceae TaxID=31 RepID=UPI00129C43BA|nr:MULTISPECIES: PLP-dependent aminotransferase family protein [Myxococcaceae]MBF5043805.1 PLP-dependent aminotransferase family protein [Simulacricoccus sp. 17bor-14]MRI89558.1 PLP-dependent aminotransferase family protein [Aggregicoccus sp. 17bor-14]
MPSPLDIRLDRSAGTHLSEQIRLGVLAAIRSGALAPGARLPSWLALAAQLGVARGTVKAAYERLTDEQVIVASRPGGTRVADSPARAGLPVPAADAEAPPALYQHLLAGPAVFQMGVPASDGFPARLLARLRAHAARDEVAAPALYPDPRGEPALRREIAAHLALARGLGCRPSQVFVTAGFAGGLALALRVLGQEGSTCWMENPGFFQSRRALELARVTPVPVPVDAEGLDVAHATLHAPGAALALVTPGQQAPLGATLSLRRRVALLEWAQRTGAWILEDDYLGELQLERRAAPALASLDQRGRVLHLGSFSKTISPALRLGFVVVPQALEARFTETVMCLGSAPGPAVQHATAEFMRAGHYLRHLRRMKRVYAARGEALRAALERKGYSVHVGGLAAVLRLPEGAPDAAIAQEARRSGLAPEPLSRFFSPGSRASPGLLLGIATAPDAELPAACERLHRLIRKHCRLPSLWKG